jgi:hypothetical protein
MDLAHMLQHIPRSEGGWQGMEGDVKWREALSGAAATPVEDKGAAI